ncbi:MAG: hypothetical protein ACRDNZ_03450 [Streptosporangiaceae bacterium]
MIPDLCAVLPVGDPQMSLIDWIVGGGAGRMLAGAPGPRLMRMSGASLACETGTAVGWWSRVGVGAGPCPADQREGG